MKKRIGLLGTAAIVVAGLGCTPAAPAAALVLHECRLQHPLRLTSVAARCGMLRVAENPDEPSGETIALSVAVVPSLNRHAEAPPLYLLAGGPGQSATDLYVGSTAAFARINRSHDIVLVDQRGTGHSAPLVCQYPDDWSNAADPMPALRDATRACLAKFGPRVRYYTTSTAVGDLEKVRIALGHRAIEIYGSSYGTRVAQLYMRRFPQAVRAAILDGVTYPQQNIGPDTPADGERALNLIVQRCVAAPGCSAAYPNLRRDLENLRARFGRETQAMSIPDPSSGLPIQVGFNRSMLNAALRLLSYNSVEASLLPALVHRGATGDLAPLASQTIMMARQVGDQLASGMQNSVICSEDVPRFSISENDRQRLAKTYQGTDQIDALQEICHIWPVGPVDADLHDPLHSDTPTLLLSGDADPVTPPEDAERAAMGLTHHRHLVLQGEGHGQLATGCVPRLMADFLDGMPPAALDAQCLERHRPEPFFVGPTGPSP